MPFDTLSEPMGYLSSRRGSAPAPTPLIIILGDSNAAGFTSGSVMPVDLSSPGLSPSVVQPTAFVDAEFRADPTLDDPPNYATVTGGVTWWSNRLTSDHDFGVEIAMGYDLTSAGLQCVLAKQGVVSLQCAQSVPSPSPAYPSSGPSWFNTLVTYCQGLETAKSAQTQIAVVFEDNNDGLNPTLTAAIATNNSLLANGLVSSFPHLRAIIWMVINADTINFSGFQAAAFTNQANWFAANPTVGGVPVIPINWDDLPLRDHAHGTGNTYMTLGQRLVRQILSSLSVSRTRPAAFPQLVGYGPTAAAQGTIQPSGWGGADVGFLEVMIVVQMVGSGTAGARTDPSGWTLVTTGVVATATPGFQTRMSVYRRTVDATMLSGNHNHTAPTSVVMDSPFTDQWAQILSFWGSNTSAPTVDFAVVSGLNGTGTSYTLTGGTTLGVNRTIVFVNAGFPSPQVLISCSLGASNVTGTTQVKHGTPSDTAFVSLMNVQTAQLAGAGPTGNTVVTLSGSCIAPIGCIIAIAS